MREKAKFTESPAAKAWNYFFELSEIPRPSGHEEKITDWLRTISAKNNWNFKTDSAGNVLIAVPGTGSLATKPPLVLQGHLDMVCEKNSETEHDFLNDPLQLKSDGEWVTASGTTLGADNGVAIALALALAEEQITDRLPLEMLFTVAEETGLAGANALDPELASGKTVLNLDSEEEGTFIIGCAGGEAVKIKFAINCIPVTEAVKCTLSGLRGGHSGMDVGCRNNAIIAVAKIMSAMPSARLHQIIAGDKTNAIPRECVFVVSGVSYEEIQKASAPIIEQIKADEPHATITVETTTTRQVLPESAIQFISSVKNGVISMNPDFPGVVQSSTSITIASEENDTLTFFASTRSSSEQEKAEVNDRICELAEKCDATAERLDGYPGWSPSKTSLILNTSVAAYEKFAGKSPRVQSIHAGLECGIIGSKINSTELVSMGPTIKNPHSPEERLNIPSFDRLYTFLKQLIQTDITG